MGSNQLHGTTGSSATKNAKGHQKLVWFLTHSLEHIPKIRRKPVRCYVRQKHIIPTLTDGFTCVEKHKWYVFHGRKKRVSEHPLIESRGAVFRRSEDRLRFKSIIWLVGVCRNSFFWNFFAIWRFLRFQILSRFVPDLEFTDIFPEF